MSVGYPPATGDGLDFVSVTGMTQKSSTIGQHSSLRHRLLNLVENHIYKIIFAHEIQRLFSRRIPLNPLLAVAGLEPGTLCLEDIGWPACCVPR